MADRLRRRGGTAALATVLLLATGCVEDSVAPPEPQPQTSVPTRTGIRLGDISVGDTALAQRAGLYLCGEHVVASAPAGGIRGDSFVVFDADTGKGEITEVDLPDRMRPNARWLLSTQCVQGADGADADPVLAVSYQEMPLVPGGGSGIRAAYTLDGERLWRRADLNAPATVVDDLLVLGATPEQPKTAVDLRTGETVATFDPSVQARVVVSSDRMVVRALTGPAVLTTLTGRRITTLRQASTFSASGGLLFGVTPAALPDAGDSPDQPDSGPEGLTDASPSPSPTQGPAPQAGGSGPLQGLVQAYSLRTGEPAWRLDVAPDPLGRPTVEPQTGVAVVVDSAGVAHGVDPATGREDWRTPTEMESPRVTAASGIVLFDKLDEPFQKVVVAESGLPLPEQERQIVDLGAVGALQIVEGVPTVVPADDLRTVATPEPTD